MHQKLWSVLCGLFLTVLLASCSYCRTNPCNPCLIGEPIPPNCPNPLVCTLQICKEPIICTIPERNRRIAYLTQHGVKIIHVGETITVVLPSDKVFYPDSANLNPCFIPILKVASDFIFCYEKMTVRIAAYSDCRCDPFRNTVLTQAQAQTIAKTFWCNGIDARLLYAVGYGSDFPIASNANCMGQSQNRRIEICFRFIPPYSPSC
ncbi:MAG: OmpA family protein [Gammaproteobacteria bacterium]|nr:OmpA family protein [Gammaproteobacteria bacterium]